MFNENFRHGATFTVNADDYPFITLKELVQKNGHSVLKVDGVFTFIGTKGKGKGKERPVLIANGFKINLPDHCINDVKKILSNTDYIDAINAGHCGFQTTEYEDKKNDNGICYSGIFVDI